MAWLAWLQAACASVVELVAAVSHRPTPNLPLIIAPARHLARRLVSSATLVGMLVTSRPALAQSPPRPPAVVMTVAPAAAAPAFEVAAPAVDGTGLLGAQASPADARIVYRVQPWEANGDCLWNLADRYLGDGMRWREIFELNRGLLQDEGGTLEDPSLIMIDWELVLPADAVGVPAEFLASNPALVEAEEAPPAPQTRAPSDEAVAPSARGPSSPTTSSTTSTPVAAASSGAVPAAPEHGGRADRVELTRAGASALRYGVLGLPVLAAGGVVLALNRRRRAQVAACRPGRDIRRPSPELEPLERRLRSVAAEEASEWVDAALRALAAALSGSRRRSLPDVVAVRPGELGIEVLLSSPDEDAPAGWEAVDGGYVWRLDEAVGLVDLQGLGEDHCSLSPALVSLGASPEGPVLVDLEALGALSVEGDPAKVSAFLAGVALELACAPWAQGVDVRLVGAGPAMAHNDDVTCLADAAGLEQELTGLLEGTRESLAEHSSTLAARLDPESSDDWPPTVVVVARPGAAPLDALERLAELTRTPGAGVVLVAPGPLVGARWRLVIGVDATASLEPLGLAVHVAGMPEGLDVSQLGLDEAVIDAVGGLLAAAADVDDVAPVTELPAVGGRRSRTPREAAEVWVSVLGPVEVTGWATPIGARKKFAELVTYLATHDDRAVPGERLHAACWPGDDAPSYKAFKETLSRARNHLGDDSRGRRHLPPAVGSAYHLGPHVGCDWVRFQDLVADAARAGGTEGIRLYREALELVRGEPFDGVAKGTYGWAWSEGLVYEIELAVARAAAALGQLALDHCDPATARWASAQGLLASPTQQSLFRVEMRAAAELADTDGIVRAMEAATRAQQRVDPEMGPPEETVELYRHLAGQQSHDTPVRAASRS